MTRKHFLATFARSSALLLVLACGIALPAVAGCGPNDADQRDNGDEATALPSTAPVESALRTAMLRDAGIPGDVRGLILLDLGDAQVSSAQMVPTETGERMYRIGYIVGGEAREQMYDSAGRRVTLPPPREAATIDQGTPAQTPPATRPAGDGMGGGGTGGGQ